MVTVANCSLTKKISVDIGGVCDIKSAAGRILTGEVHSHNDFQNPKAVGIKKLTVKTENGRALVNLPACSVAEIIIKA